MRGQRDMSAGRVSMLVRAAGRRNVRALGRERPWIARGQGVFPGGRAAKVQVYMS